MTTSPPPPLPLTPDHRRVLRARRLTALAGSLAFAAIVVALFIAGVLWLRSPALFSRGQWVVWLPLALLWLWWLAPALPRLRQVQRDLAAGLATTATGELGSEFKLGIGLVQTASYTLTLGPHRFAVDAADYHRYKAGGRHRVTYAPHSHTLLAAERWLGAPPADTPAPLADPGQPALEPLTPTERELLRLIAAGRSNKEIAAALSLSVNTVKVYNSALFAKLAVSRRTEAVARARELRLL